MFENTLIESSSRTHPRTSILAKTLSLALETLLLGIAVLAPLLYTEALPRHVLNVVALPAPPPAAAAPHSQSAVPHIVTRSELNEGRVILPGLIPHGTRQIQDEVDSSNASPDSADGVVGSVSNRVGDATIASVIRSLPAAMPKTATPQVVRVSSGVAQGLLVHQVSPQYPSLARSARIQGIVVLQATISKDGTIQNLHLLSGHPLLAPAAMEAVRQWRYRPYLLNDEPVEVDTTIQVNFTLNNIK